MHTSVGIIAGKENTEEDAVSRLTQLPVSNFTCKFNTFFPYNKPLQLRLLTYAAKYRLVTMLHTKRYLRDCPLPPSISIPLTGSSGRHSAPECASNQITR